jgi:hypothetical protein
LVRLHHDHIRCFLREERISLTGALKRLGAGFRWLHRAIVSAKLRRLQSRMMFRHDYDEMFPLERDLSKHAQRPLILGDKWDF